MKKELIFFVFVLVLISFASAAHPDYPAFAEAEFSLNGGAVSISDDIIYNTGYYSVNGAAWQQFNLQGTPYGEGHPFLLDSATGNLNLPSTGTHYVILFSCSLVNNEWDCHENKWQLEVVENSGNNNNNNNPITKATSICLSCDDGGCSCTSDEECSAQGVCLLDVPGRTLFVSPNGRDSNSGSYNSPWGTWDYAFERLSAGDILYMRGGEWKPSGRPNGADIGASVSNLQGTQSNPIRIFNYPGEVPILNGEDITPHEYDSGVHLNEAKYVHLKGFTIKNIKQPQYCCQQPSHGTSCRDCENIIYENLVVHDVDGRCMEHADWQTPSSGKDVSYWINVDVYNCFTPYEDEPGNAADAIVIISDDSYDEAHIYGVRTWNFADDGINAAGNGFVYVKNSWSMSGDKYYGLSNAWNIEANGIKMSIDSPVSGNHLIIENSIVANCMGRGIQNNNNLRNGGSPNNALIRNNFVYEVGKGNVAHASYFEDFGGTSYTRSSDFKNNIDFAGSSSQQHLSIGNSPQSHNSWNLNVDISNSDFLSLDYWELFNTPRKSDGSLPDVDFGKLRQGSNLIDAGTVIDGYHCSTPGSHSGEDCREWYGSAPDLGPFESNY